jgi:hypothetical protein
MGKESCFAKDFGASRISHRDLRPLMITQTYQPRRCGIDGPSICVIISAITGVSSERAG